MFNLRSQTKITSGQQWFDIAAISLLCLCLFCYLLGAYPLINPDEARYSEIAREMLLSGNYITPTLNGVPFLDKPPLFYWLQAVCLHVFGVSEWSLRLWPAIAGTLGCLFCYITGSKLFNRRVGWTSAIILATSLLYFLIAHFASMDLTVAVFISGALFSFMLACQDRQKIKTSYMLLAYTFAGLAVLTKGLIGLALPTMVIGLWILFLRDFSLLKRMRIIPGILIILAINVPWYYLAQHQNPIFLHYFFYVQQFQRYLTQNFNNKNPLWTYPVTLLVGTAPWSIYCLHAFLNRLKNIWQSLFNHRWQLFLLLWIISITTFFSIPASKTLGYIIPVFPAIALLTAQFIDEIYTYHFKIAKFDHLIMCCALVLASIATYAITLLHPLPSWAIPAPLHLLAIVLLLSAIILFLCQRLNPYTPIVVVSLTGALSLLILMHTLANHATQLGVKTQKPIAAKINQYLKPNDIIVSYENYYYDIPIYTGHYLEIMTNMRDKTIPLHDNWQREFLAGFNPNDKQHFINVAQLQKLWRKNQRIWILVDKSWINKVRQQLNPPVYSVMHYRHVDLITNKPLPHIQKP